MLSACAFCAHRSLEHRCGNGQRSSSLPQGLESEIGVVLVLLWRQRALVTSPCHVGTGGQKADGLRSCRRRACCPGPWCPEGGHSPLGVTCWLCPPRLGTFGSGLCEGERGSAATHSTAPPSRKPLQGEDVLGRSHRAPVPQRKPTWSWPCRDGLLSISCCPGGREGPPGTWVGNAAAGGRHGEG